MGAISQASVKMNTIKGEQLLNFHFDSEQEMGEALKLMPPMYISYSLSLTPLSLSPIKICLVFWHTYTNFLQYNILKRIYKQTANSL